MVHRSNIFIISRIHYVKRPGAILEPASVLATLELDDPNRVKKVIY